MARILLIRPPWDVLQGYKNLEIPLNLCYLASVLKTAGHDCLILDGNLIPPETIETSQKWLDYRGIISDYDRYLEALRGDHPAWNRVESLVKWFKPSIVGITIMTGTYGSALRTAKIVKKMCPDVPVIVGGPHPTILPEDTLREDCWDVVVKGEGEYSLLELVNCLERRKPLNAIRGISYKEEGAIRHNLPRPFIENLDLIPFPARDLIFEKERYSTNSFGFVLTSRGCPYNCIFCASHMIWGRRVRYRSAENVIAEIKEVKEKFGTKIFRFNDDAFTIDQDRVRKICRLIIEEKLDIKWYCGTEVDLISYDLLRKMKEAGCVRIHFGVETGNPRVLKSIKKGVTLGQVRQALKMAKKVGITTITYFMIGFPDETRQEVRDTINFMKELKPDKAVWGIVTPYPGTELYGIVNEKGLLPNVPDWATFFHHSPDMAFTDTLSRENLLELIREARQATDEQSPDFAKVKNIFLTPTLWIPRAHRYLRQPKLICRDFRYFFKATYAEIKHR